MSMIKRRKLILSERLEMEILLAKGYSYRQIAKTLGRSPNTISYETATNSGLLGYNALNANQYAATRKKDTRREWSKIEHNQELRQYIIDGPEKHWNPDEISGRMKEEKKPWYASKTAIYEWLQSVYGQRYCIHLYNIFDRKLIGAIHKWLQSVYGQRYCIHLYTQRYHRRKRIKKTEIIMIPARIGLEQRFLGATNRTRYGHWERDTIVSRQGCSGGISVGLERKARVVIAEKVKTMSVAEHNEAVQKQKQRYKTLSVTYDNGLENRGHQELKIPTFFCEPYSSWQKGGVENANKMIRHYFPKGTNFREVSQKKIDQVVSIINNKPRRILGYQTALEVAEKARVLLTVRCPN